MKKTLGSQSAFLNPRVLIGMLFLAGLLLGLFAFDAFPGASARAQSPKQNSNSGPLHKVSISDRGLTQTLRSQGGRVIADYGSFVLFELSDETASRLRDNPSAQIVDENNLVLLNAGTIDTNTPEAQVMRSASGPKSGKQMRLIQFAGPIRPEWHEALVATGAHVVTYIPSNAYLVYGTAGELQAVQKLASNRSMAQWDGDYTAAYRLDPAVTAAKSPQENLSAQGNEQFTIQMVEDATENAATMALIEQSKLEPIIKQDTMLGYFNVTAALPRDAVIHQIAERGDVVSIQQWSTPRKMDERQDTIMTGNITGSPAVPVPGDYLAYLTGKGFDLTTPASFAVNLSDSGVDNGTTTPNHFALYRVGDPTVPTNSRIIYNRLEGTPNTGSTLQGCDGHGNLNSHIISGYVPTGGIFAAFPHADASGFRWGLGLAPFVKVGSSVIFDPSNYTSPVFQNLESQAYRDGARISSNSWGSNSGNTYDTQAQQYDALVRDAQPDAGCSAPNCISTPGNQEYTIVFAAGNSGPNANTVHSPGTAKNLIVVGAAENVNPFGGMDGSGIADSGADNANDIISFSGRGPTADQRKKPDIVAPGTHVSGGVAQASIVSPTGSGTGAHNPCFTGSGVSGGLTPSKYWPLSQEWYTASSGTSHSTPATAGVAALIRQYFINQALTPPTPAMTKALMVNSARYMTGVSANDTLPSNSQGMGEINLNSFFDIFATANIMRDEVPADLFTATGQTRTITATVSDNSKPLRVTLVWTDAFGPTTGNAFVNNLDLQVIAGGNTYLGNVFTGAFSTTGGTADIRNNVESVFLPAGVTGNVVITVKATNIAGDGVPNNGQPLDQDFSLVVYNAVPGTFPVIAAGTAAITAESCAPSNNLIDPGETVTVNFPLSNVGTANTTNVVATLQATGSVTSPSGPQNYGALMAGGSSVTLPFTFTSGGACGQPITATFQLQDGATNLGTVTFTFQTGVLVVGLSQNFDGVVAPALPAGWVASNAQGTGALWVTSTNTPDSAPNDAFIADPQTVSDKLLTSPSIAISSSAAQVSFRNNYIFSSGFDGGVLEVSSPNINGGTFTDITAAAVGGSFVSGGYNGTLATAFSNPIGGRSAWSGNSGGYITTVANLGSNVNGQTIKLRFRMGSDSNTLATGWRIDTIQVSNGFVCCGAATPTPAPTSTPTPTPAPTLTPTATPTPTLTPTPTPTPTPAPTAAPTPTPAPTATPSPSPVLVATVSLPIATVDTSMTNFTQPVVTSAINPADNLVGFQGDFTFDETVVTFQSPPVSNAGLTGGNWNVSGNVLPGSGPIRILRVSAFSNDFTPLSGSGTLYNLNMTRVSSTPGAVTPLVWQPDPDNFIFIDGDLNIHAPGITPPSSITIQAATVAISGTLSYCSNPVPGPVPNVTLTLSGSASRSTLSDGSGNYTFASLPSGGSYTVTPANGALAPGSAGINTIDVIATQRHFLNIGTPLSGCRLTAADVNADTAVNTVDVIAIQRFFLTQSTGIANVGKYQFSPANRTYPAVGTDQTAQNYDTLIFGDVAASFADRAGSSSQDAAGDSTSGSEVPSTVAAVALPEVAVDRSRTNFIAAVKTTAIDAKNKLVGFQGDFTFDERVVTFQSQPVSKAGITSGNWNVSANVLAGAGPIRTLRISAYSNDFRPLSGSGILFNLNMTQVSKAAQGTQLLWAAPPDGFIFIDADLNTQKAGRTAPGSVTSRPSQR